MVCFILSPRQFIMLPLSTWPHRELTTSRHPQRQPAQPVRWGSQQWWQCTLLGRLRQWVRGRLRPWVRGRLHLCKRREEEGEGEGGREWDTCLIPLNALSIHWWQKVVNSLNKWVDNRVIPTYTAICLYCSYRSANNMPILIFTAGFMASTLYNQYFLVTFSKILARGFLYFCRNAIISTAMHKL